MEGDDALLVTVPAAVPSAQQQCATGTCREFQGDAPLETTAHCRSRGKAVFSTIRAGRGGGADERTGRTSGPGGRAGERTDRGSGPADDVMQNAVLAMAWRTGLV